MLTPDALAKTQKSIYQKLQDQIRTYQVSQAKDFHFYQRSTRQTSYQIKKSLKTEDLVRQNLNKNLILFGDFHPFPQCQKGFLRFLKLFFHEKKLVTVALEIFYSSDQSIIDNYLHGKISLGELFEELEISSYWPFTLSDYSEILRFCKTKRIRVIGINSNPNSKSATLKKRDTHAASVLRSKFLETPNHTVLCLIGDLHLHRTHLPKHFSKNEVAIVHQNIDSLYFRAIRKYSFSPDAIQLGSNEYCIFNSVPWVKYQSYLDWLEGGFEDASELDSFEQIHHFAEELNSLLGMSKKWKPEASIHIFPEKPTIQSPIDELIFRHAFRFFRTSYLPSSKSIVLPILSSNAKTEAAALLLWTNTIHALPAGTKKLPDDHFVYLYFLGFIGSKILNPNRKCNEVEDLFVLIHKSREGKQAHKKAVVAATCLAYLSNFIHIPASIRKTLLPLKKKRLSHAERLEALRLAGYILGNRFFYGLKGSMKHRRSVLKKLFVAPFSENYKLRKEFTSIKRVVRSNTIVPPSKRSSL